MNVTFDYVDPIPMDGLIRVTLEGKWGCIDVTTHEIVIPCNYQFIGHSIGDHIFVKNQNKWGIIKHDGTVVQECQWDSIVQDPEDPGMLILTCRIPLNPCK